MTDLPAIEGTLPDPGELPVVDWVSKHLIDVDHAYQRPEDAARAEKIARAFSWSKFGAVVLVPKGDRYAIIDGQHRAAAAKLHPLVEHLPAVIMPSVQGVEAEATSFIGLNAERKAVSGLELHHARLAAGDPDAQTLADVVRRAGARIPKNPGDYKPGDTIAVAALQALIGRHGAMRAREYLEILVRAECCPVQANQLKAVECLMSDPEFRGQVDGEDLTSVVKTMGAVAEHEGKRFAATHCVPFWKGLASTWFQKCKKRRPAAAIAPNRSPEVSNRLATAAAPQRFRTIVPNAMPMQRNVTAAVAGDPAPGRSALDQKRTA